MPDYSLADFPVFHIPGKWNYFDRYQLDVNLYPWPGQPGTEQIRFLTAGFISQNVRYSDSRLCTILYIVGDTHSWKRRENALPEQ